MIAKSGDSLLSREALDVVQYELLRLATVVTPNAAEAAVLADMPVITVADARRAAERIRELGSQAVIVKGGHLGDHDAVDVLVDERGYHELRGRRIETRATHGTGCTFAAAIAANLALGCSLRESADRAKQYVTAALEHGLTIGHGYGPLNHLWFAGVRRPERIDW
jgi:hydroxymethylpyrimidine/phosphomethylpyrimidine kinase